MSELLLDYLTPESLGLDPNKFPSFRDVQLEGMERAAFTDMRFIGLLIPPGGGKSVLGVGLAVYNSKKTVILTYTLALMEQYLDDFKGLIVAIKGKNNYECGYYDDATCRDGAELGCPYMRGKGCTYETAKAEAMAAPIIITNYAYWMTVNDKGTGLDYTETDEYGETITEHVEQLICDEGHEGQAAVSQYASIFFMEKELEHYIDIHSMGDKVSDWVTAAKQIVDDLKSEVKTIKMELEHVKKDRKKVRKLLDQLQRARKLYEKVFRLAFASEEDWVCEQQVGTQWGRTWKFDVIWPGRYAEKYLFCGVEKVVLMSATLRRKSMGLLGISQEVSEFHEWPRIFPLSRCPVYYYPARDENKKAIRITRNTSDEHLALWVEHIDKMLEYWNDRRVVVITTSYKYAAYLREKSKHARYMVGNTRDVESDSARETFEKFIVSKPPTVLVSPSFGTGWNFSMDRAEVLIIPKLPLKVPAGVSKLMAVRLERDKEYGRYLTSQDITQWIGRLQRSDEDAGTCLIVDGCWDWFGNQNKHLAPRGLFQGVKVIGKLPPKLPKLIRG